MGWLVKEAIIVIVGLTIATIVWTIFYFVVGFGYTLAQVGVGLLSDKRKNRSKR